MTGGAGPYLSIPALRSKLATLDSPMHHAPLFLGLTRPPKIFGLPISYFVSLMLATVIPFVGANDWRFMLVGCVGYPALWFVADRDPNLFEVASVVFSRTPRSRGRAAFGGDAHVS